MQAGSSVTFNVQVETPSLVTYQWSENGTAVPGATASSLTIASPTVAQSGTLLSVQVSDAAGSAVSSNATLSVTPIPAVLAFASIPAVTYGAAPFSLMATSASSAPVSYAVLSGPAAIAGSTLTITGAGPVVIGASQVAQGNYGSASAQVSFTVNPNVTLSAINPANPTLAPGLQAFSTTAVGGALDTVTWSASSGTFSGNVWTAPNTAGTYTITATSIDQPSRSIATQATVSGPVITMQPVAAEGVCDAARLSLSVVAQYAASYQWSLNAKVIPGANASTYTVPSATLAANDGAYGVTVANPAGSVVSTAAVVSVGSSIATQPASETVTVPQTAQFSFGVQGQGPFTYQWLSIAPGASAANPVAGATASSIMPVASALSDGTKYFATATDRCGEVLTSNQATLTVQSPPVITAQPSLAAVAVASSPTLTVGVAGDPAVSYQWYSVPAGLQGATPIAGAIAASYTIPATATTTGDNGDRYYVIATNSLGQVTSSSVPVEISSASAANMWVVGWGASPENALPGGENPGGNAQSFRSLFYPTVSGTTERVHLSNLYNTKPVTVGAARLGLSTSGSAVDPTQDKPLTFNGQPSVTLGPGQEVVSDPVDITYTFGQKLAVSLFMEGAYSSLTQHESQVETNYATPSGTGDTTADSSGASFTKSDTEWFVVSGVDVYGAYQGTVAIFGSSSVDGHGSNDGDTNAYPVFNNVPIPGQDNDRPSDWLARQLFTAGYNMGVLNAGTIGDSAAEDARTTSGAAVAGVDRMGHDVLQQAGIKTVVIYFGGVDIRGDCVPATTVEASLTNMAQQAQVAGVRVILATLPPSEYCTLVEPLPNDTYPYNGDELMGPLNPSPENPGSLQRRLLNDWIRTTGLTLPGVVGIADFDQSLADPDHPDFMMPHYFSADQFHPNGPAYGVQSSAIPLHLILPQ